jgi:hypothetical protein
VVVATLPYWAGPGTFKSILYSPPTERLNNSLLEMIMWPLIGVARLSGLRPSWSQILVESMLKTAALIAFGVLWLREFRRARDLPGMLSAWAWILFWYVVVASGWFWPWYVTWPLALAALCPWDRLSVATVLLAGGALTQYAFQPLFAVSPLYGYRALFIFGPALAYGLWWAWREGRLSWLAHGRGPAGRARAQPRVSGRAASVPAPLSVSLSGSLSAPTAPTSWREELPRAGAASGAASGR